MTQDIRSVSRWLHSKSHSNVFSVTNPQGRRSESLSEAAAFIHQYWVDFWQNHHTPPEDQITAHLRQGLPTIHPTEFPDLETEHVISIFRKQRGSAGPDGWSGSELSHLPDAAIDLFVKLAQRWELVGRAPLQMRQARMATLPKPGKSENGSISVQSTRPITVLNTFWQIWNSSKIAHLSFQLWIRRHIPGEIAARRGSSISGVAAQIIEDFAVNGYLLSLDWSKCFDTFSAACSAQLMRDFGLPVGWSNVCQDVWVNQQRWVCFQGCVHGTPLTAPHSIPQGDPLGPILCMLWTTCGHNSVRRAVPVDARPARTVLYMDDRSVTSSSAQSLSHHKNAWSQWSGHVGLIENESNESKVSLAVKSPKLPVPALLAPFVQSSVRVLGAYTAVARRCMCPDEEQRLLLFNSLFESSISMLLCLPCLKRHTVGSLASLLSLLPPVFGPVCVVVMVSASWLTNTSVLFSSAAIPIWKFSLSNISWVLSPAPSIVRSLAGMAHLAVLFAPCVRLSKTLVSPLDVRGSSPTRSVRT